MGLKDDLSREISNAFEAAWQVEKAQQVPAPESLRLNSNHAKNLDVATVLYADMDGSTNMVDSRPWWFSAEVYRAYLRCAAAIIKLEEGVITAYDGDRVMAVFTGKSKNTSAVRCAMRINYAVLNIIQPAIAAHPTEHKNFDFKHKVGVDTSELHAARIGVRGDNDLVWIGRAANHAAKLNAIKIDKPIWISADVYKQIHKSVKYDHGVDIWKKFSWPEMNDLPVYATDYWCGLK
jgi:class 3 adenylate cyclase